MEYCDNLMILREKDNLTKVKVSQILEISDSLYSRYENNKQTIPIKHLNTLCNYYKVSLDYMFGFTTIKKYKNEKINLDLKLMAKRLKEFRKENTLTQEDLANILKNDNSSISKYEKSHRLISTSFLYEICKKYSISADYLLGKVDNPKYLK